MSQICVITSCKRSSSGLCHCCQQNICLSHVEEHQDLLIDHLNPIVDEINALSDRLKAVSGENMINDARQKLEQWRMDCYKKIDDTFERKSQELDRYVAQKLDKQKGEMNQIQLKVSELVLEQNANRHDLNLLTLTIRDLEQEMKKIEETSINVKIQSLHIDDNSIIIEELNKHQLDLSPVYKTNEHPSKSFAALASNDRFLLMHQQANLCLANRDLIVVKKCLWNHDFINMSWSSVLDRFIVIDEKNVFLVDQNTMAIELIPTILTNKWRAGPYPPKSGKLFHF